MVATAATSATLKVRVGGMPWPKKKQLITMHSWDFYVRQRSGNQRVGSLLLNLKLRVSDRKKEGFGSPYSYPWLLNLTVK